MSELKKKILDKIQGNKKKIVLVEGTEDGDAYDLLFKKKYSNWEPLLSLYPVNGKNKVIKELKKSPDFIGIIDKDEWSEEDIVENQKKLSNLIVTPRFCMESYLVVPEEIWEALPAIQREKVEYDDFRNAILENIETWTKHAALWHAVQPLYSRLKNSGFHKILLNEIEKVKDKEFIRGKLNEWHKILDPDYTFKKYESILSKIDSLSVREKLHHWIHGKKFWEQHVSRKMNSFFGQKAPDEHAIDIWRYRGIPEDWNEIWQKIEEFQPALKIKK